MYIGGEVIIPDESIIVILNKETTLISKDTRRVLDDAIGAGRIQNRAGDAQRSYIIAENSGKLSVHASPIGSEGLCRRNSK